MIAFCQDKRRRNLVLAKQGLNGIDYAEVLGSPGCGTQIAVTFLKDPRGLGLSPGNIALSGESVLTVQSIAPAPDDPLTLVLSLDSTGDFAPYTLTLVSGPGSAFAPAGIDPQLASVAVSFKAGCPSPADCVSTACCPSVPLPAPDIHSLARDYDGFRQQLLDRMAVLVPGWTELHAADPAITILEVLAYAADRVSYLQDAVNTEAYLGTARSRISLRRHARLVDYRVREGCNARAWVCLTASNTSVTLPAGTAVYPLVPGLPAAVSPTGSYAATLAAAAGPVFATIEPIVAFHEHNELNLYAWGDGACCLPAGTTEATLVGTLTHLYIGQVLLFEEAVGPLTGEITDANPLNRCAVRLTAVTTVGADGTWLNDPIDGTAVTAIAWATEDALPFPLCISSVTDAEHGARTLPAVSVARGNVVAADAGEWVVGEDLGPVPAAPATALASGCDCTNTSGAAVLRPRYEPVLQNSPLTFAAAYDPSAAASSFLAQDVTGATPQIRLAGDDALPWAPAPDLLEQDKEGAAFVVEVENDGSAHLRFGDGTYGMAPLPGQRFSATYRVGNGAEGNVGREALAHVLVAGGGISGVRNPMAAAGGTDPETAEHIRQVAPSSFQTQLRCVTADDYGTQAAMLPGVREGRGSFRWTGAWYTAFVSVDPTSSTDTKGAVTSGVATSVTTSVTTALNTRRMMGTDIVVERAIFVGLRITLGVCVRPNYFRGDVYAALWKALVTGDACLGSTGLLDAANFSFGETVYASPILAMAQSIAGVASVTLTTFARVSAPVSAGSAPPALLQMGALEIPRCDNDPDHSDRGLLVLTLDGGK